MQTLVTVQTVQSNIQTDVCAAHGLKMQFPVDLCDFYGLLFFLKSFYTRSCLNRRLG